ncbi:phosphatase PAP2 family protein [Mesorhizobium sp.]|uniref:phosphatase PAP2 family protein n=2 Tax=Mesorhizobium sp. TaxID=1871066 RepID=UPI0025B875BB|nr:phosphatase PAP2 family protein [Mesorhizobium sp.]
MGNLQQTIAIVRARFARRPANYSWIPWPALAGAYLLLTVASMVFLDGAFVSWRAHLPSGFMAVARAFTNFGLGGWFLLPPLVLFVPVNLLDWQALSRRWRMVAYNWTCFAFFMLSAVGLSGLTVTVLKYVFGRARPALDIGLFSFHPFKFDPYFASFPSGHATNMGAAAAMVMLLFPSWGKYVVLPITVWIAATRVVVGAHYPSDTIAGFGLGMACAVIVALIFARLGFIFRHTAAGLPIRKKTFRLRATWRKPARPSQVLFPEAARP